MALEVYGLKISPPCWTVLNVLKHLDLEFNMNEVNVLVAEQHDPEFVKMNPQHCIPTIVDGDLVLWESRAIVQYLANKYNDGGTLYPSEPEARARVDQKLNFDMALNRIVREYYFAKLYNIPMEDPGKFAEMELWIGYLEIALEDQTYVASSDEVTIADYALMSTITFCHVGQFPLQNYPNVLKWFEMCKETVPSTQFEEEVIDFVRECIGCGGAIIGRVDPTEEEAAAPGEGDAVEEGAEAE